MLSASYSPHAIVVPSYKRGDLLLSRNMTLSWVTAQNKYPVFLALRESEANDTNYRAVLQRYNCVLLPIPDTCVDLGLTLDYIMEEMSRRYYTKLLMYDDDLVFSKRNWDGTSIPRLPYDEWVEAAYAQFALLDKEYPYNALRHRAFAQSCTNHVDECKRTMWTHGVYLPTIVPDKRLRFSWKYKVMTDFHFHLSVLAAGRKSLVLNDYCADDAVGPYKNDGGCNSYRTLEMRTAAAFALQKAFPEAVNLREKSTPSGTYMDVTVHFSKALGQWNRA